MQVCMQVCSVRVVGQCLRVAEVRKEHNIIRLVVAAQNSQSLCAEGLLHQPVAACELLGRRRRLLGLELVPRRLLGRLHFSAGVVHRAYIAGAAVHRGHGAQCGVRVCTERLLVPGLDKVLIETQLVSSHRPLGAAHRKLGPLLPNRGATQRP